MTWASFHRRGEILRTVIDLADARRDGILPMEVPGVVETFGDEMTLLGALQLRWHTRLAGRIERELMSQPMDLEQAVVTAWQATVAELPGIRAVVDRHRVQPLDEAMAEMMRTSTAKERILMAVMAGRSSAHDDAAARVGAEIEARARSQHRPTPVPPDHGTSCLLDRIKAALVA